MNVLRHTDADYAERKNQLLAAAPLFEAQIEERTRAIIQAVAERRDAAIAEFTERFDGVKLAPAQWAVTQAERMNAALTADEALRQAVAATDRNVAAFARRSRRKNWSARNAEGGQVGEKFDPYQRVGIYIPGGTAPLVSTALMTITLARVAGCPQIVVCTPPGKDGSVNPALLYAAMTAGATEIYKVGGAQAIAALALGTETIARVQKIFGPGNAYVVAAKRLLVGHVAIDLLPGPSEVLVLADDSANPRFVAADLLAQAEHGSGHERVWLLTPSAKLLKAVEKEMQHQLPKLARRAMIETALRHNGWLIQLRDLAEGIELVNALAPEHLELHIRQPARVVEKIYTAGAIFIGPWSPTVLGDYVAGPSHTLPTGGAGASFPGLTVDMFQRRTSVVTYDRAALKRSLPVIQTFAQLEGLDAHGQSAAIRFQK
ncbi:histidinol dehydrogenase [Fontisphaera persica]|uniref:histidinol dehydrogenase n=1 Tax=Fontisphaera persica TaxID=2974023 RepID=UPI0024C03200|nr:histidinol dehydrogenase [Fontisphaera persica]WCJ57834.1 histidinol dehydrogenase [Fontisphaera persica]